MKGSEKQIKWAQDIINGAFRTLDWCEEQHGKKTYQITCHEYLSKEAIAALRKEYTECLEKVDDAARIIEKRDMFSTSKVIDHGREWMWHKGQLNGITR